MGRSCRQNTAPRVIILRVLLSQGVTNHGRDQEENAIDEGRD